MAQDVYRQAADRPLYEPPPPLASVMSPDPPPKPVLLRDDELAPMIFDEDVVVVELTDQMRVESERKEIAAYAVLATGTFLVTAALILAVVWSR